jgi:hypothetical protein
MTDAPLGQETRIFQAAILLPDGERETFLLEICKDAEQARAILEQVRQWELENRPAPVDLATGELIDNRFRILDRINSGGMGEVFLARDEKLRKRVALKRLLVSPTPATRDRVWAEAVIQAQITHPNVAATYDIVEHEGQAYIVMEYVEGESLAACLRRGRLPLERVFTIGRQMASALAAAHAKGIIHRDVKPANIQLAPDGSAKLLDFGIAAVTQAFTTTSMSGARADAIGPQPGTPGYMSPEQIQGLPVDERSDIFSLGLVLFEMATGERAYLARDVTSLKTVSAAPVRQATNVDRRVPRQLTDIIARAVQIDPGLRYQSAAQLEDALVDAQRVVLKPSLLDAIVNAFKSVIGRISPQRRSTTLHVLAAAAGVVVLVAAVTGLGYLTSTAFNLMLERTEFAQESWVDWLKWGGKSLVAPVVGLLLGFLALVALAVVRNLAVALSPRASAVDKHVQRYLASVGRALRLDDVSVMSSWLLLVSGSALVAAWWLFSSYFQVLFLHISTAEAKDLALLSGSCEQGRHYLRQALTAIFIVSALAWYQIARIARRHRRPGRWTLVSAGFAVALLALLSLEIPYRLFFHADFPQIPWNGQTCYVMGEREHMLLVFCPTANPRLQSGPRPADWTPGPSVELNRELYQW